MFLNFWQLQSCSKWLGDYTRFVIPGSKGFSHSCWYRGVSGLHKCHLEWEDWRLFAWQGWLSATAVSSGKRFAGIDSHKMLFGTQAALRNMGVVLAWQNGSLIFTLGDQVIWFWDITPFGHPLFWEMISTEPCFFKKKVPRNYIEALVDKK